MPRLENWSIVFDEKPNHYLAPELMIRRLHGNVYNHDGFCNGWPVMTSTVIELDIENHKARTRNTEYELGEPSEEYINWLKENGQKLGGE